MLRGAVGLQLSRESVGWATSLAVHVAGGLAAWMVAGTVPTLDPSLAGRTSAVRLTATWQEPVEPQRREPTLTSDMEVLVRPCQCEALDTRHASRYRNSDVAQPVSSEVTPAERSTALPSPVAWRRPPPSPRSELSRRAPPPARVAKPVVATTSIPASVPEESTVGTDVEDPPRLLTNAPPAYPVEAAVNRWQGTVLLRIHVAEDGRVKSVEVITSSGHAILDAAAVRAVRGWRFRPARRSGRPITCTVRQPLRFNLTP